MSAFPRKRTLPAAFIIHILVIKAAPGVHPARARRIAANIAKLPELLRKV
jgi:hypothetical protein